MNQSPNNSDPQPDVNSKQQGDSSTSENVVQGSQNRTVQGHNNQAVLGESSIVNQGNNNNQNIHITNYYYHENISLITKNQIDNASIHETFPCPYRSLFHFGPDDAEFFFGREVFIEELIQATTINSLIPVIGASGSGKSSVVLAGLVPRLQQQGNWIFTHFRPGSDPFYALSGALIPLYKSELDSTDQIIQAEKLAQFIKDGQPITHIFANIQHKHSNKRILLIVDQFEELYTLCQNTQEQQRFIDILLTVVQLVPYTTLMLTLRSDFLSYVLDYSPFGEAIQKYTPEFLSAMSREQLLSCIECPAQKVHIKLEQGLAERILDDVKQEPGNLPLLEFTLSQLWTKQEGGKLTHQAYSEIGGVAKALANHAEAIYLSLKQVEQKQAQQIFLQLVRPGEGTSDTRRLAMRAEIENWELVRFLASPKARLVVTAYNEQAGEETVEMVHEALILEWDRLHEWMETDRNFRIWQERLRTAVRQWKNSGKDEGALWRGLLLAESEDWQEKHLDELTKEQQDFIEVSVALRERERDEQERSQILTKAHQKANRLIRGGSGILAFSIIGAIIAGIFASNAIKQVQEAQEGTKLEQQGVTALQQFESQELEALLLAMDAGQKLKEMVKDRRPLEKYPAVSPILALQTILDNIHERNQLFESPSENQSAIFSLDGQKILTTYFYGNTAKLWDTSGRLIAELKGHEKIQSASFCSKGERIMTVSSEQVKIWDTTGKLIAEIKGHQSRIKQAECTSDIQSLYSPYSSYIVTLFDDGTAKIWANQRPIANLRVDRGKIIKFALSETYPYQIITISNDSTAQVWDNLGKQLADFRENQEKIRDAVFIPYRNLIATISDDDNVKIRELNNKLIAKFKAGFNSHIFAPDSQSIVTTSDRADKMEANNIWDISGRMRFVLEGHKDSINSVRYSSDGKLILTASNDGTAKVWDELDGKLFFNFKTNQGSVSDVIFSNELKYIFRPDIQRIFRPYLKRIFTISQNGVVGVWDIYKYFVRGDNSETLWDNTTKSPRILNISGKRIVAFNPDVQRIVTSEDIYNLNLKHLNKLEGSDGAKSGSFSPNGQLLVAASFSNTAKVWNLNGKLITTLKGHEKEVNTASFSPDGQRIVTASQDNTAKVWDLKGKLLADLKGHQNALFRGLTNKEQLTALKKSGLFESVNSAVFSPDGQHIVTASNDCTAKVWDLSGKLLADLKGHEKRVNTASFSPDGQHIVTASDDSTAKVWDLNGKLFADLKGHKKGVNTASFSPDGQRIVTASDDSTAKVWDLNGKLFADLKGHEKGVNAASFSTDGQRIFTKSNDGNAKVWDLNGRLINDFRGDDTIFSPDRKYVVVQPNYRLKTQVQRIEGLDELLVRGCDWLQDYFVTHPEAREKLKVCWAKS